MKRALIAMVLIVALIFGLHLYNSIVVKSADARPFKFENYLADMNEEGDSPAIVERLRKLCKENQTIPDYDKVLVEQAGMNKSAAESGLSVRYNYTLIHWRRLGSFHPFSFITHPSFSVTFNPDGTLRNCYYGYQKGLTGYVLNWPDWPDDSTEK